MLLSIGWSLACDWLAFDPLWVVPISTMPSITVTWWVSCCRLSDNPYLLTCKKKVKLSLCSTNSVLLHEGVWGSACIDPHFLDLGTSWRWVVRFTPLPLYPRGKSPRYPSDRRLGGPQSRSGRFGEEKILDPTGTRTATPQSSSQALDRLNYPGSYLLTCRKEIQCYRMCVYLALYDLMIKCILFHLCINFL
jgi:hypothetical protein